MIWLLYLVNIYINKAMITPLVFNLGFWEIVIIALVVLLLFGGKKIPELMRGLGKGVRNFKDGMKDIEKEVDDIKKEIESDK